MLTLRDDIYVVAEDKYINMLATHLHTKLLSQWSLDDAEYRAYGRCYRNPSKDGSGYIPEVFKGGARGREYAEVMVNDKVTVVSFFGVGETITYRDQNVCPVHLIVAVNLERLWGADLGGTGLSRADADARVDVQNIVHNKFGFDITAIKTGVENVYAEYPGVSRDRLRAKDMQPYHLFRIDFDLTYNVNNSCVKKKSRPDVGVFDDPFADVFD